MTLFDLCKILVSKLRLVDVIQKASDFFCKFIAGPNLNVTKEKATRCLKKCDVFFMQIQAESPNKFCWKFMETSTKNSRSNQA